MDMTPEDRARECLHVIQQALRQYQCSIVVTPVQIVRMENGGLMVVNGEPQVVPQIRGLLGEPAGPPD